MSDARNLDETAFPLASVKTFFYFFFASKFCLPDVFFDFQVFYSRSHFWKPKKQASGSQNFRLLEVKKISFWNVCFSTFL